MSIYIIYYTIVYNVYINKEVNYETIQAVAIIQKLFIKAQLRC